MLDGVGIKGRIIWWIFNDFLCLKGTSQKNGRKKWIIRIFCELLAEMRSGSLINRGGPEGTVEMKEARRRALTRCFDSALAVVVNEVEKKEARRRALTRSWFICSRLICSVEMREARRRALTLSGMEGTCLLRLRRNERSPKKGIDTLL